MLRVWSLALALSAVLAAAAERWPEPLPIRPGVVWAPVLPLRDEPDLLTLLEASGRLVADEETAGTEVSTVEEEELSALMGEKEDYNQADEQPEEDWED